MKTGRLSPREEEDRMRAAREAVGPDVELLLDCNNAWGDVTEALRTVRRLEAYDPYWLEEPFGPDDIDSHARLARLTRIPIATAEIGYGRWYHQDLLAKGAAAILQTDAAVCGGITEWRRIAATAASHGVVMCPHWFHDLHAPLVASTPNARYVEFFGDDQVLNFRRLVDRQLEHKDGRVVLRTGPGLGFDFDESAVAKHSKWKTVCGASS
ncbi:MAG: mandelate racemase/muconate lactonizing enzyme family protein, partial [Pseudomonadota bacterium]|nr:mandelate racemase/muconate lactonizing enzyme family protein [Pseudomonadota bacterium]